MRKIIVENRGPLLPANGLERFHNYFEGIQPWQGPVKAGFIANFIGTMTDTEFDVWNDRKDLETNDYYSKTTLPTVEWGEGFFEWINVFEAAKAAREQFIVVEVGGGYGARVVDAFNLLKRINPMPAKLVLIEGDPGRFSWAMRHFHNNGIDPAEHWLIQAAVSDTNKPTLFPYGGIYGDNKNISDAEHIRWLTGSVIESGVSEKVLRSLLSNMRTGVVLNVEDKGPQRQYEVAVSSSFTLGDLLAPFSHVDLVDIDIQGAESYVLPPFMGVLNAKVSRVHMGTHGADVHAKMRGMFLDHGWELIFDYGPNGKYETPFGGFILNDGVLSAVNPRPR